MMSALLALGIALAACVVDPASEDAATEGAPEDGAAPTLSWSEVADACRITEFGESVAAERVGGDCAQTRALVFSAEGELRSMDGEPCTYVGGFLGDDYPEAPGCWQEFVCGSCEWSVKVLENDRNENVGRWQLSPTDGPCTGSGCEYVIDPAPGTVVGEDGDGDGDGDGGSSCSPPCTINEYCSGGECKCADGCRQGFACCGGTICGGDCVGTPCC
ncbi:MAG: hypothetical protein AAF721_08550 [Myxococcota bacterium]